VFPDAAYHSPSLPPLLITNNEQVVSYLLSSKRIRTLRGLESSRSARKDTLYSVTSYPEMAEYYLL